MQLALRDAGVAVAVLITILGLVLFAFTGIGGNQGAGFLFIQDIEQRTLDARFALRGKRAVDPRIVIVGIDEKTLQMIGSYPLPRSNYALLVRQLKQSGARVIAFDVTFPTAASSEALDILARLRSEIGASAPAKLQNKVLHSISHTIYRRRVRFRNICWVRITAGVIDSYPIPKP